jgi:hypothetical protein
MGFYINMLRESGESNDEFMGNPGFDDTLIGDEKSTADLNKVALTVMNNNAERADEASQEELDGQDFSGDPVEEMAMAIAESEHNWNLIFQGVARREISEAARGRVVVTEGLDSIKSFFGKIKLFFVKLFKKITAVVKQVLGNLGSIFHTNKGFAKKYGSKLSKGKKAYEDNSKKDLEGYPFWNAAKSTDVDSIITTTDNDVKSYTTKLKTIISSGDVTTYSNALDEDEEKNADEIRGKLLKKGKAISSEDWNDELKRTFFGSEDPEIIQPTADYIKRALESTGKDIDKIKKNYAKLKTTFTKIISTFDKLENSANKWYDNDERKNDAQNEENRSSKITQITRESTYYKNYMNICNQAFSMFMKSVRAQGMQARRVAQAWIFALNKSDRGKEWDKADNMHESYTAGGYLGNVQMI